MVFFIFVKNLSSFLYWISFYFQLIVKEVCKVYKVTSWKLQVESYKLKVTSWKLQVESYKLKVTSWKLQVESYKLKVKSWKLQVCKYFATCS